MARKIRLHVPGGFYHVTLRGNHRQPIFFADADRDLLDTIFAEVTAAQGARIHAYCWMTNHLHALIQVSDVPLGRVILRIASRYARTVQARMSTTGHLFERRYHCVLVDAENYLLTLIRYIHLNPVRAGLVTTPSAYRWSSHLAYLGKSDQPWITTTFAMSLLTREPGSESSLAKYESFMLSAESCEWGEGALNPNPTFKQVLGDDAFASRVAGYAWSPRSRMTLDELIVKCSNRFGIAPELLASPRKSRNLVVARAWIAHEATAERIASVSAVARRLARSESSIRELLIRYPRDTCER